MIKSSLGVGNIYKLQAESIQLRVSSIEDLAKIIEHFDEYPLVSKKRSDYELWKKAYNIMLNNEHKSLEGFKKILSFKASMNEGLSDELKAAFPEIVPMDRPLVNNKNIFNQNWFAGFTSCPPPSNPQFYRPL